MGWKLLHRNKMCALTRGFSDDLTKQNIPIVTVVLALTAMDLSDNITIIIQVNKSIYLPNNKYTVVSTIKMRESQIQVNDLAKQYGGLLNITADDYELPLTLETRLLHLPVRKPTDKNLLKLRIILR